MGCRQSSPEVEAGCPFDYQIQLIYTVDFEYKKKKLMVNCNVKESNVYGY